MVIASSGKSSVSGSKTSRHRMLQIRGLKEPNSPKERLNENYEDAVSFGRQKSHMNLKPSLTIEDNKDLNMSSEKSGKTLTKSAISRAIGGSI